MRGEAMHWVYFIVVFGMLGLFSATVIWAMWWALRGGQFSDFQRGATSIFDADEPVGKVTDAFPDQQADAQRVRDRDARREAQRRQQRRAG